MDNTLLFKKLASLPENLKEQVADFVDFLLQKNKEPFVTKKAKFGSGRGIFVVKPGFDDPLEDFKDYTR